MFITSVSTVPPGYASVIDDHHGCQSMLVYIILHEGAPTHDPGSSDEPADVVGRVVGPSGRHHVEAKQDWVLGSSKAANVACSAVFDTVREL